MAVESPAVGHDMMTLLPSRRFSGWARLPVALRAIISGLLMALVPANVWPLLLLNLGVPLAAIVELLFLALYVWWAAGGSPPRTTQAARATAFRRGKPTTTRWSWGLMAAFFFAVTIHAAIVLLFRIVPYPMAAFRQGYDFSFIPSEPLRWIAVVVSAASVMRSLVDLDPDNVDVLFMAQRLYSELANDTMNKLAVLAPGSARMQQVIAERLVNAGDLKGAIEHYRKALEIDPRLSGVRYELGEAIFEASSGDASAQAEAEKELEAAITLDGDSAAVQGELGKIALAKSDLEKAHAHYARAFALDAGDTSAQLGMGGVLMTMNNPQEAKKYLEMAVKSDPLNEAAHYRLALAYKRLQMPGEAQREIYLLKEIKKTKDQVQELYRQMNVKPQPRDEVPDSEN